jgi:hypothetical protein
LKPIVINLSEFEWRRLLRDFTSDKSLPLDTTGGVQTFTMIPSEEKPWKLPWYAKFYTTDSAHVFEVSWSP